MNSDPQMNLSDAQRRAECAVPSGRSFVEGLRLQAHQIASMPQLRCWWLEPNCATSFAAGWSRIGSHAQIPVLKSQDRPTAIN